MINEKIKVALIGAGFISGYHIKGLQAAGADVVAISGTNAKELLNRAQAFNIPSNTTDYRQILEREDVRAVVIATPDYTHKDITIDALQAGKAVLLQKPMARTSAECLDIIEVAEQTGTALYVSFMHRYFEEVQNTRRLLADNALGHIYSVRQRNATPGADWAAWFFRKKNVGGGALIQLGVHGIDLLRYLLGEIVEVKAEVALMKKHRMLKDGTIVSPDNEDLVFAIYRFESGVLAMHETVYNEVAGTDRFRMEIYGEKGTAWLRTEKGELAVYAPDYYKMEGWFIPELPCPSFGYNQHKHFLDMLTGAEPTDTSVYDGLATLLVAEAIYRSAETGEWEEVIRV